MGRNIIIAIDPGAKGSISFYNQSEGKLLSHKMPETPTDILELLQLYPADECICYLEKVGGMPGMGGSSMFNFGRGYGHIEMALLALKIPTESIRPQMWMKELGLGTKGDRSTSEWKNHLKERAQQLFPNNKFTLDTSDAALIAWYAIGKEKVK